MQIEKIRGHQTDQLFKAVLELKDIEECYKFLMIYVRLVKFNRWHNALRSRIYYV